jgi:hypothetical protein
MTTSKLPAKTFCVRFTSITGYKLTLQARSPREAMAKAKRQWRYGNSDAFIPFDAEEYGWDAEEE